MIAKFICLVGYIGIAAIIITNTTAGAALKNDANSYYTTAIAINSSGPLRAFLLPSSQFIDRGYPTILALAMQFFGDHNIYVLQSLNYLFWLIATLLIYQSLRLLQSPYSRFASCLMLFSPLYLTFSAKLYSEPFAALGMSLLIYSITRLYVSPRLVDNLAFVLGSVILFSVKTVLLPAIIPLAILFLIKRSLTYLLGLVLVILILLPSALSSLGGGRSLYNLAIQSSKLDQRYDEIIACVPYYLSYPVGQAVLPTYQGVCHQNNPTPAMSGYSSNPYVLAEAKREKEYTYLIWLESLLKQPVKYLLILTVSLANVIFVEGVYPSILLTLPAPFIFAAYLFAKIILSLYLWMSVLIISNKHYLYFSPILFFILVVTHFPVEPRYFYPFIPYLYFLAGLSHNKATKQ